MTKKAHIIFFFKGELLIYAIIYLLDQWNFNVFTY